MGSQKAKRVLWRAMQVGTDSGSDSRRMSNLAVPAGNDVDENVGKIVPDSGIPQSTRVRCDLQVVGWH